MSGDSFPSPLRVLEVDDCRDTTRTVALLLNFWGHEVRVANDGANALAEAYAFLPHVVMLDVELGMGMNGYEVAHRLRALPDFQDTLLICMTGFGRKSDVQASREAGFDHHLLKPTNPELLQRLLDGWKSFLSNRMNEIRKKEECWV
jgi:two-component system CheB/CheR fusion protein